MPLYNFTCESCGEFTEWRQMSCCGDPVACPECGNLAPRAVSAPFIRNMPRNTRIAHERNEKSAHEPRVMSRAELDKIGRKRSEAPGHHHRGHHHGGQHHHQHRSSRPWMIGH